MKPREGSGGLEEWKEAQERVRRKARRPRGSPAMARRPGEGQEEARRPG